MKAIILGGKGYLGKHFDYYLRQMGVSTFIYDIEECDEPNYKHIDITDAEEVMTIDFDVDYVFMLAGLTGTYAGFDRYKEYTTINEIGMLNLLDAIRRTPYRPKVIFPSSRLVYKGVDKPLKEDDEKETKTVYAINKMACEGMLEAYRASFDIPYTIFRICIPFGNMLSKDYSFGTIGFFIRQASAGKDITLYGGGELKRTFTHMEDVCHQVIECSMKKESDGQIYNVGGETLTLREAAEIIAGKYGTAVTAVPWPERDLRIESDHTYFDSSKIESIIEQKPYKRLSDFTKDL